MGIPGLFRQVASSYPDTYHYDDEQIVDHFFMDYNSTIHDVIGTFMENDANLDKLRTMNDTKIINTLVNEVVNKTVKIVSDVKPQKLLYIGMDGSVPMGKMKQQRERRYKTIKIGEYQKKLNEKYNKKPMPWSKTANISPGTKFMKCLSKKLQKCIDSGKFSKHKHNDDYEIILSDTLEPGEGEHKIMKLIRKNGLHKTDEDIICISSPDADVIVLGFMLGNENVYVLRMNDEKLESIDNLELKKDEPFLFLSVQKYINHVLQLYSLDKYDKMNVINDITFLTFLGGDDFVKPLPFLGIKDKANRVNTIDRFLDIYKNIMMNMNKNKNKNKYLTLFDKNGKPSLNIIFFKKIMENLAKDEQFFGQSEQKQRHRYKHHTRQDEAFKTPYEIEMSHFEHDPYYDNQNPFYEKYHKVFEKIDYFKKPNVWKEQYYSHYFGITTRDYNEYKRFIKNLTTEFIKSLMYTFEYYLSGDAPSWTWYYRFRVAPFMSDISHNLQYIKNIDELEIKFEKGRPFTTNEQLMLILPPQSANLLPKKCQKLMTNVDSPIIEYYPIDFELDVLAGKKLVYSEPILPEIDVEHVLSYI